MDKVWAIGDDIGASDAQRWENSAAVIKVDTRGALGNGTADDAAAINQAIQDAGKTSLPIRVQLMPGAVHAIQSSILAASNVSIDGNGATLKWIGSGDKPLFLNAVSNVQVSDLTVDCGSTPPQSAVYVSTGSDRVGLTRVKVINPTTRNAGIQLVGATNSYVEHCVVQGGGQAFIVTGSSRFCKISHSYATGVVAGVLIQPGASAAPSDIDVEYVTVTSPPAGVVLAYPIRTTGTPTMHNTRIRFDHCTVVGPGVGYKATNDGTEQTGTADQINGGWTDGWTVTNCVSTYGGDMGYSWANCTKVIMAGNQARYNCTGGIACSGQSSFVTIVGNICMNNGQNFAGTTAATGRYGINSSNSSHVTIGYNVVGDDQVTPTQNYGISTQLGGDDVKISGNTYKGNVLGKYYTDGSTTNVTNSDAPTVRSGNVASLLAGQIVAYDDFNRDDLPTIVGTPLPTGQVWSCEGDTDSNLLVGHRYAPIHVPTTNTAAEIIRIAGPADLNGVAAEFQFHAGGNPYTQVSAVIGATPDKFSSRSTQLAVWPTTFNGYDWQVFDYDSATYNSIATGRFLDGFAIQDGVSYRMALQRVDADTVSITLPDGQQQTISSPLIATGWGAHACIQSRGMDPTGTTITFSEFAASRPTTRRPDAGVDLVLTGDPSDFLSTLPVTLPGDVEIIAYLTPDTWTSTASASKRLVWQYGLGGKQTFTFSFPSGANAGKISFTPVTASGAPGLPSTAVLPFTDGQGGWIRVAYSSSAGTATYYTSSDPKTTDPASVSWTQLGTPVSGTGSVGPLLATNMMPLVIGGEGQSVISGITAAASLKGKITYLAVHNGIGGPIVAGVDFRQRWTGIGLGGERWGISGDGWTWDTPTG